MAPLKPILNRSEARVDRHLAQFALQHGYKIAVKMRLRDMIGDDPKWTPRYRNFAFTAHLDFVIYDAGTLQPLLAVEYDGPQHEQDDRQRDRDIIKDHLCEQAELPMLRIDSGFARKSGRWTVLGYILEMHEIGKAYSAAQEAGQISIHEEFIHNLVIDTSHPGQFSFTGLDARALLRLRAFTRAGCVRWWAQWARVEGSTTQSKAVLALNNGQFLSSSCALRTFSIEGISSIPVAEELATAELGWLIDEYEAGAPVALDGRQASQLRAELVASNGWWVSGSMNPPSALES